VVAQAAAMLVTRTAEDGDHQVAQAGHDLRAAGGADLRAVLVDVEVADPVQAVLDPQWPRSMSFYDTCVAPRYRNGPTGRRRLTGAEAFELEGVDPCYIDIDGFWPKGADGKGPERVPIAN
jgi:hypothetical protein